jgi:hypothetical protein
MHSWQDLNVERAREGRGDLERMRNKPSRPDAFLEGEKERRNKIGDERTEMQIFEAEERLQRERQTSFSITRGERLERLGREEIIDGMIQDLAGSNPRLGGRFSEEALNGALRESERLVARMEAGKKLDPDSLALVQRLIKRNCRGLESLYLKWQRSRSQRTDFFSRFF